MTGPSPRPAGRAHPAGTARAAQPTPPIRVVLVDDHWIVREGLRSILEDDPALEIVGEAASGPTALAVVESSRPDIVLLDLRLRADDETEGLQLCRTLTDRYPGLGVLVLTTFLDRRLVLEAIQHGARGYVLKDVDGVELLRSIHAVRRGESAFDSRSAAIVVDTLHGRSSQPAPPALSDREQQVLTLLARGLSNRDIGRRLYISETTVKFHVGNIMRKLGVGRRTEVVYTAGKLGLI